MTSLDALTQTELLAVSLEATRRGDAAHSLVCLKEAAAREDASAEAYFLLGSHYAQLGLFGDAATHLGRAVEVAPDFAIARFQLGLLHLTNAQPNEAQQVWAGLADLPSSNPLVSFREGLQHLIRDEFADCVRCLERGIEINVGNPALNADMRLVIERVKDVQAGSATKDTEVVTADEQPQSPLFLNAYSDRKIH